MAGFIVVDDFLLQGAVLQKIMAQTDYDYDYLGQAASGEEGIEMARKLRPDLIFIDIEMPGLNGLTMAEQIKTELPGTNMIILSAHDNFTYAQRAISLDIDEYLLKPVTVTTLKQALVHIRSKHPLQPMATWETHMKALADEMVNAILYGDEVSVSNLFSKCTAVWTDTAAPKACPGEDMGEFAYVISKRLETQLHRADLVHSFYRDFVKENRQTDSAETAFSSLYKLLISYSKLFQEYESQNSYTYICQAKQYIQENIDKDISLISLSESVFLSPSHLSRLFKQYEGMSFSEYLLKARLALACRLLVTTTDGVELIASKCGYGKANSFWKMFKKQIGMSPGQYRRQQNRRN